jgi:oligoendopeptidase F
MTGTASKAQPGGAAPERSDIPAHYKWDLDRIFPDWSSWQAEFNAVELALPGLRSRQGTLARSSHDLLTTIEALLDVRRRLEIVHVYAALRSDEDTRIGEHTARRGRAGTLTIQYREATSWFEPELLSLPAEQLAEYRRQEPRLALYDQLIRQIEQNRPHTLSPDKEELLAAAGHLARGPGQVFSAFNNADLRFPVVEDEEGARIELTKARYSRLIRSPVRRVRRRAFQAFMDAYRAFKNTMAANLDAHVRGHAFYARTRGYADALEAALAPQAIPVSVYHDLLASTGAHLAAAHRFTSLKKRVLAVDPLREYDLYTPLFPKVELRYSYEQAQALLRDALAPLGVEYLRIVEEGFAQRWIDVHENRGKRSGAYSSGAFDTSPYILLNWSDQLHDTFTLAHEMGHSVHTYLSARQQPYVYADYPIFTAEVASTCNEILLMNHLLGLTTERLPRLHLLDYYLTQINQTVFRQVMFADFEYQAHRLAEEGETLTADLMEQVYTELLTRYWGPDVDFDPQRSPASWLRIPHFYYRYYVFQYATAYAAAVRFARALAAGDRRARQRYLAFLGSGSSRFPLTTLQKAGVDLTTPGPLEDVFALFSELLEEIESLLASPRSGPEQEGDGGRVDAKQEQGGSG